jgi:DNA-binding cell septation regulator SpoVG
MTHEVTIKQIREIKNSKRLVATADVNIDSITQKGFKILRTEHNSYWVANPQSEASGKFYDMLEFLDWELEQEVKAKIISAYQKMLQSRTVIPETAE